MQHLTIVMPYYRNPNMLAAQYDLWDAYPDFMLDALDFIIVDDGSPEPAAGVAIPPRLPVSIYRVKVDIPWNQHGARNLGAHVAKGPWLLMTDMDHMLPAPTLAKLLDYDNEKHTITFGRVDAPDMQRTVRPDGTEKPHPNTFACTKEAYWKSGGYDEDYCGMYGTDGVFTNVLFSKYPVDYQRDLTIIRVPREVIPDASTTTLPRKEGRPKNASALIRAKKKAAGREHKLLTLNFPWERMI